jgi:hypothetical protein
MLASFFENTEEAVTRAAGIQIWLASITGTGYKVQVVSTVGAAKSGRHKKSMVQAEVVPALAKNARTGHPRSGLGQSEKKDRVGHPPRYPPYSIGTTCNSRSSDRNVA